MGDNVFIHDGPNAPGKIEVVYIVITDDGNGEGIASIPSPLGTPMQCVVSRKDLAEKALAFAQPYTAKKLSVVKFERVK